MKKFLTGVRGKQVLVSGLAVLVLVAGYFRWSADNQNDIVQVMSDAVPETDTVAEVDEIPVTNEEDYFSKARYERDCARSEATELLMVSAENNGGSEDTDSIAAEKIAHYAKCIESETAIENMVISKGYADCVAFVDETGVRVVVKSDALEKDGVTKIKDIVIQQTGAKATEIKISSKK